jgi:hypothetical protein
MKFYKYNTKPANGSRNRYKYIISEVSGTDTQQLDGTFASVKVVRVGYRQTRQHAQIAGIKWVKRYTNQININKG